MSPKREMDAHRTTARIAIDAHLDEADWHLAVPATGFTQNTPNPGNPARQRSDVRVLYDDDALYIGAMLYDTTPDSILHELSPRDVVNNTDWFGVVIDPYRDGLNGLGFIVTAAGVQRDLKISVFGEDVQWNAVWQSAHRITDSGWVVEMRIPYATIRFPKAEEQSWGINFIRTIRRYREESWWNPVDPNVEGNLNQAGVLNGIRDITPPLRLFLFPYMSGYLNAASHPADGHFELSTPYNFGADLKYGINDAFTLDMTLVPDFGQVIFDDEILNLSPFEVRFNENRQFFTEGTELFNKGNVFYSRRIGDRPMFYGRVAGQLREGEHIVHNPMESQLINATKISGRNRHNLGIGFFNALEARAFATVADSTGNERRVQTNPLSNYNMVVLDQNLPNNSFVTLFNTSVWREGDAYNANVTGMELQLRDKPNRYFFEGGFALSQKYFGDGTGNDLGHRYKIKGGKMSGRWRYTGTWFVKGQGFDPNDFGFLLVPNEQNLNLEGGYYHFDPFWKVLWTRNVFRLLYGRLHTPNVFTTLRPAFENITTFSNFLTVGLNAESEPVVRYDYFEPRTPGRYFVQPKSYLLGAWFSPDYRKTFLVDGRFSIRLFDAPGRETYFFRLAPRWRVNNQLSFIYRLEHTLQFNDVGFVARDGSDIIFGHRDVHTWEQMLTGAYIFTPVMSLSLRARHYWSKAEYSRYYSLLEDGGLLTNGYTGELPGGGSRHDVSFNALTVDLAWVWQFAPGSEMSLVWKQSIFHQGNLLPTDYFDNWRTLLDYPQQYSLSIKVLYFLDYLMLKKHLTSHD